MSLEPHAEVESPALDSASGRALIDRVKASSDLSRSPRLRQLFEYLCERSFADPGAPLSEERISVDVFGRSRGYDTGADTIVRVQVSQLRRKLERYFLSEGAAEPVIIDVPKRSYTPVLRLREQAALEKESAAPVNWRAISLCLVALLAVGLISAGWWLVENKRPAGTPLRDRFWSQLFRGGRPTQLVTSDATAMALCDFLGRTLTPAEYIGSGYPNGLIDSQVQDPAARRVLRRISSNFVTNMPDVRIANQLSVIAASSFAQWACMPIGINGPWPLTGPKGWRA